MSADDAPPAADPTFVKLTNVLGEVRARALIAEVLAEIDRTTLAQPDDRLAFGEALVSRGGLLEAIGRAIRVQAFLMGARDRGRSSKPPR